MDIQGKNICSVWKYSLFVEKYFFSTGVLNTTVGIYTSHVLKLLFFRSLNLNVNFEMVFLNGYVCCFV